MVTALLPDALFYSEYAMTDAIFPVLVLGWLLTVHGWLTATSPRARYAAAVGSALLAGYAYTVHSRGLVMVAVYVAAGILILVRRLAPRGTVAAAALALCCRSAPAWCSTARWPRCTPVAPAACRARRSSGCTASTACC
jgi:hypothetical protein